MQAKLDTRCLKLPVQITTETKCFDLLIILNIKRL